MTFEVENERQDLDHNLVADWDLNTIAKIEVAHLIGVQYPFVISLEINKLWTRFFFVLLLLNG